jgi:DNA uptake protein ComE-like DNA-binding protein
VRSTVERLRTAVDSTLSSVPTGARIDPWPACIDDPPAWPFIDCDLASATGGSQGASAAKVDLNAASEKELEGLPGVGPATAKKIMAGRPYGSVADLSKAGVPAKTIEKITPLVSVGAGPGAAAAPAPATAPPAKSAGPSAAKPPEPTKSSATQAQVPPAKGMVWVNTKSGVFHYEGDRWYGKTKEGKFMTEADALKAGYHGSKEGAAKKGGGG